MKKLITAIAMTASLGLATSAHAITLAEFLDDGDMFDSDQTDFDIVTQAITVCAPELGTAADGAGPLTVFLPTDKAFRILVEDVYGMSIEDEMELFMAIATALECPTITSVLQYHIIADDLRADDVLGLNDGDDLPSPTLLTGTFLKVDFKGRGQIRLMDNEPALRDPIIRDVDIIADNGVAHVIDRVLLPIAVIE